MQLILIWYLAVLHRLRAFSLLQAAMDAFEEGVAGRVEQVKPDDSYRHPQPLGRAHEMCVARARNKAATRKAESMRALVLPDGSHVDFSKDTRAAIDPKLIQRIRYSLPWLPIPVLQHAGPSGLCRLG